MLPRVAPQATVRPPACPAPTTSKHRLAALSHSSPFASVGDIRTLTDVYPLMDERTTTPRCPGAARDRISRQQPFAFVEHSKLGLPRTTPRPNRLRCYHTPHLPTTFPARAHIAGGSWWDIRSRTLLPSHATGASCCRKPRSTARKLARSGDAPYLPIAAFSCLRHSLSEYGVTRHLWRWHSRTTPTMRWTHLLPLSRYRWDCNVYRRCCGAPSRWRVLGLG